jgi:DNA-binding NtrC family response regulator
MRHFSTVAGRDLSFTDEARRALLTYRWPGNVRELRNVIEQLVWLSGGEVVGLEHLPVSMQSAPALLRPIADRRRRRADDLYDALVKQSASFWEHVYPMFLARDITRHDIRELVRRGLRESRGRYKSMLTLFGMSSRDYRRFINFLAAHDCKVGFREFRETASSPQVPVTVPPVLPAPAEAPVNPIARSH